MSDRRLRGSPDAVATRLLGAHLRAGAVLVRLVEVEAYGGFDDPASHAYRGKRVANATMFGPAGRLYVYRSHGIHLCANITCGSATNPSGVLLRGGDVLEGLELVRARRGRDVPKGRLSGPGRLCQGLGITHDLDGLDVLDPDASVSLTFGRKRRGEAVVAGPRVGLTKEVARPWRFQLVEVAPLRPTSLSR